MSEIRSDRILFPGGKLKAYTMSFDDGVQEDERLIALFEKYGIKATFNLNSGRFGWQGEHSLVPDREVNYRVISEEKVKDVYRNVEVSAHGYHHMNMIDCPPNAAMLDVCKDVEHLETLFEKKINGFAYPYGGVNEAAKRILGMLGIKYARAVVPTYGFEMPKDFLEWHPTCHFQDEKRDQLADDFIKLELFPFTPEPAVFYVWGHGYELSIKEDWGEFEEFLRKIAGHEEIWYATNGEIADYWKVIERLEYSCDRRHIYNPSCMSAWLQLDEQIVEIPGGSVYHEK